MACGCQKKAQVRAAQTRDMSSMGGTPTRIYFYAVPPPEDHENEELKFRVLKEARAVAKERGWIVQQRRETLPSQPLTASSVD